MYLKLSSDINILGPWQLGFAGSLGQQTGIADPGNSAVFRLPEPW